VAQLLAASYLLIGDFQGEMCIDFLGMLQDAFTTSPPPPYSAPTSSSCTCPNSWLSDGMCDTSCNTVACNYDMGDCSSAPSAPSVPSGWCAAGCPPTWPGDGMCDTGCNTAACNYDSGDCPGSGRRHLESSENANAARDAPKDKHAWEFPREFVHTHHHHKLLDVAMTLAREHQRPLGEERQLSESMPSANICQDVSDADIAMWEVTLGSDNVDGSTTCLIALACAALAAVVCLFATIFACPVCCCLTCGKFVRVEICMGIAMILNLVLPSDEEAADDDTADKSAGTSTASA